ncbi:hypothetical protein ABXJ76_03265 [Methylobacter sp. G7]|uniref:hypothetical protein n=1 Tax=Methylobacter sp. G7 TaxID=3230117 RepID=UPI003D804D96
MAEYQKDIASGRKAMEMQGFDLPTHDVKEVLDVELAEAGINLRGRNAGHTANDSSAAQSGDESTDEHAANLLYGRY